ncbi:hypothetical protein HGO34_03240 [Agrobacterium vitis]|uniref:Uncharacterized protein n=1 Tax=Agrobacterium vitis TaxID=373 RepID=A0AAE5AUG1_AGRVI|nr:hypothetical protein [Agrobacterium vitis]MCF1497801.1 hypothetical protein [Allorhizobium sp. Av2]MCM2438732.1 hypothetical protein [Agrobacterium vitis]MUZ55942.1 hypothetical protein [Agrobacterium vitis]MVA68750.1 hypothetical protein [Agrobacterium vitis]MVA89516.1 hypothetical protein [Agrobacterium vitis]
MTAEALQRRHREVATVNRLRGSAERLQRDAWTLEATRDGLRLIVQRPDGELAHIATIHRNALHDERDLLCGALDHLRMFLHLFDRAAVAVRDLRGELEAQERKPASAPKMPNHAAQASILLSHAAFQRFLSDTGGGRVVDDKDSADAALKDRLGITSKKQINEDDRVRAAWLSLFGEYEAWLRGGGEA